MERMQPTQPSKDSCRKRPRAKSVISDDSSFTSTATDEEVEQFFAILRQMHAAKMMTAAAAGKGASNRGGTGEKSKPQEEKGSNPDDWRPSFRLEDFGSSTKAAAPAKKGGSDEVSSTGGELREKHRPPIHGRGVALDLNADPEPEGVPVSV